MTERENPPGGGQWPNNGEVYERSRIECLDFAAKHELDGDAEGAAAWRERAENARRQRNRCYEEHQRRLLNRRIHRRRW